MTHDDHHELGGFLKSTALYSPDRIRGFIFDLAMLVGNILLAGSFLDSVESLPDRTIGIWLLVAIVTQLLGALLKAGPLRYRLSQNEPSGASDWLDKFMDVLIFFHFILFTVITVMTLALLGIYDLSDGNDIWVGVSILLAGLLVYIVWRAGKRPEKKPTSQGKYPGLFEIIADGLLWISVTIITHFFWETWYTELEPSRGIGLSGEGVVLLVALSFLFVFFYLPSRYLYLVEDFRYGRTWLRMWSAMLPLVWLVLVG